MRIDEECINHNVARMLDVEIGSPYEYAEDSKDGDHVRLMTLGYIRGVLDFAGCMKEVLKS